MAPGFRGESSTRASGEKIRATFLPVGEALERALINPLPRMTDKGGSNSVGIGSPITLGVRVTKVNSPRYGKMALASGNPTSSPREASTRRSKS